MSTLRAGTISNVAGTGSPDITGGELARARFNLNGTGTIAARDSFGISSFVDASVGAWQANFATAFPNANYTIAISARVVGTIILGFPVNEASLTSSAQVNAATVAASPTAIDATYVQAAFFGDKP